MFGTKTSFGAWGWLLLAAAGMAIAHPGDGPSPEKRKEFLEKRIAKLPAAEQRLAREIAPLRDSLMRSIGDYRAKVHDGAATRSLAAERATILALQSRIQALEARDPEVALDLLADLPGPFEGGPPHHHGRSGPEGCPRHGQGPDSLPPPPPSDD